MCNAEFMLTLKKEHLKELHEVWRKENNERAFRRNEIQNSFPWYTWRRPDLWLYHPDYIRYDREQDTLREWMNQKETDIHHWYTQCMIEGKISETCLLPSLEDIPFPRIHREGTIY